MTWTNFRRRGELLNKVVRAADERQDGLLPMELAGVADTFADELDLLAALSLKWHMRLSGYVEEALTHQPMDPPSAIAGAWYLTAADLPGIRQILDHYRAFPLNSAMAQTLHVAQAKEWHLLAIAAGLANDESEAATQAGRAVEQAARAMASPNWQSAAHSLEPEEQVTLLDRIRAVLSA